MFCYTINDVSYKLRCAYPQKTKIAETSIAVAETDRGGTDVASVVEGGIGIGLWVRLSLTLPDTTVKTAEGETTIAEAKAVATIAVAKAQRNTLLHANNA